MFNVDVLLRMENYDKNRSFFALECNNLRILFRREARFVVFPSFFFVFLIDGIVFRSRREGRFS